VSDSCQEPILEFFEVLDTLRAEEPTGFIPDSPAGMEIASYPKPQPVLTAYSYGIMALASARDHLEAVDLIVRLGQPSVAHWTSLRGLLEAATTACWIMEPGITTHERVSRSLALRFTTLTQQRRIAEDVCNTGEVALIDQKLDEIESDAESLGFVPIRNKKGVRYGIGQRKPSIATLADEQFDLLNVYRFLSSVAHCDSAIIANLGFAKVSSPDGAEAVVKRTVSADQLQILLANAAMLYAQPYWSHVIQLGLEKQASVDALERLYTQLGLADSDEIRFWRVADEADEERS